MCKPTAAVIGFAIAVLYLAAPAAAEQARLNAPPAQQPARGQRGAQAAGISVAELQELLDANEVRQARRGLELSDEQFARFLPRLEALQVVRRRAEIQRTRMINELRRMTQSGDPQLDVTISERLTQIAELDARSFEEQQRARADINDVLTLRQQALFRIFEEQMERYKVSLLTRVRQPNRF